MGYHFLDFHLHNLISAPPLKLVDLPGLDQRAMDDSVVSSRSWTCSCTCLKDFLVFLFQMNAFRQVLNP